MILLLLFTLVLATCLASITHVTTGGHQPCTYALAYCKRPYNVSRPGMERMEGGKALDKRPQDMEEHVLRDHRCFCDADCRQYGDCCLDTVTAMDSSNHLLVFESDLMTNAVDGLREWECSYLPSKGNIYGYMIGSCPTEYDDAYILNHCKRQVPSYEYDYTLDLPVVSQRTNWTYVNVYCALCNDDKDLYKLRIQVNCPPQYASCTSDTTAWRYVPRQWLWHSTIPELSNEKMTITYHVQFADGRSGYFSQNHLTRRCFNNVTATCPTSWQGLKEKILCQAYSFIVKTADRRHWYKNEYCAICNGDSVHQLLCPNLSELITVSWDSIGSSYSVLVDFKGSGIQVGKTGICDAKRCGFGEPCNQIDQTCHGELCVLMYQLIDDNQCVINNSTKPVDLVNVTRDCPRFFVSSDTYIRFPNDSVYLSVLKRMYDADQYEDINATTILVCSSQEWTSTWKFSPEQAILSSVCVILSIICLLIHIVIYSCNPPLLTLPGKNLLCLSISLFVAQLSFEFGSILTSGVQKPASWHVCAGTGLMVHFGFLATFLWMNVIAVDVFRTLAGTSTKLCSSRDIVVKREFCIYSAYAWSVPSVLVLAALTNDMTHWMPGFEPEYGDPLCWINNRHGLLVFFFFPCAILSMTNIVLFTMTVTAICRTRTSTKFIRQGPTTGDKDKVFIYLKLALIMGLTWIFGFVAALAEVEVTWYFHILLNGLQGVYIFLAFTCRGEVIRMLPNLLCIRLCHSKPDDVTPSETHPKSSLHTILTNMGGPCTTSEA